MNPDTIAHDALVTAARAALALDTDVADMAATTIRTAAGHAVVVSLAGRRCLLVTVPAVTSPSSLELSSSSEGSSS